MKSKSTVETRAVTVADFEQIYPLLAWHDPKLARDEWHRIFDYRWSRQQSHCGYGVFDGETAVGFIGFIFSDRTLNGKVHAFCNVTTWIVKPAYRGHSLSLMMPLMRLKDHTITDLSAGNDVIKLSKRLGFKELETSVQVLLPCKGSAAMPQDVAIDDEISTLALDANLQQIFEDHQPYSNCHQLAYQVGNQVCQVVYTLNRDSDFSYAHIHFISDSQLFEQCHLAIRQRIRQESGLMLIVVDSRLLKTELPRSYRLPMSSPRIYRSPCLSPPQIDNLYSELTLLTFSTTDMLALGKREKWVKRGAKMLAPMYA